MPKTDQKDKLICDQYFVIHSRHKDIEYLALSIRTSAMTARCEVTAGAAGWFCVHVALISATTWAWCCAPTAKGTARSPDWHTKRLNVAGGDGRVIG